MEKAGKLGFLVRGKSASHPSKAGNPTWSGEMETLLALYVFLPQTVALMDAVCVNSTKSGFLWSLNFLPRLQTTP
jgi:hypothetical protein